MSEEQGADESGQAHAWPGREGRLPHHSDGVPNVTAGTLIVLIGLGVTFALLFAKIARI